MDTIVRVAVSTGKDGPDRTLTIKVQRQPGSDNVNVHMNEQQVDKTKAAQLIGAAHRHLQAYERTEATDRLLGTELAEFYRKREQALLRLEGVAQKMIEQNEDFRGKLAREQEEFMRRISERGEEERKAVRADYDAKETALKDREQALEVRLKDLDDRQSTHARRQLRKDFREQLAARGQRFTLSPTTTRKRWPIHVLFFLLTLVSAAVLVHAFTFGFAWPDGTPNWVAIIRGTIGALALAATIVFYIRWNDHWFRQHANEEFRLKRMEVDIDRASWVVEMALEWRRDKEAGVIPGPIIEGVTRNLFVDPLQTTPRHPTEDLASALLGASSGLLLKLPGGTELRLDRKSLKKFEDAARKVDAN